MTWIKKQDDGTFEEFNFVAPEGKSAEEVLFPLGDVQEPDYAAAIEIAVTQMETFFQPAELTGNLALTLDIDPQVTKGAKIYMKLDADDQGNKTVSLGAGFDADAADVVVTSDTVSFKTFVYDGTAFVPVS